MRKNFIFTIDDNIRFFQDLTESNAPSLFSHPYTKLLKDLHERYDLKVQLNLFYQNHSFNLSQMTDKYLDEWQSNANWLKLSFHSRLENQTPYKDSGYQEVYDDCQQLQKEILRFAGKDSLAKTTTVHFARATQEGLNALKDCGVKGLLGLYGTNENPRTSYTTPEEDAVKLRTGEIVTSDDIAYAGIDVILNRFTTAENLEQLQNLKERSIVKVMIHEQHFYQDHVKYQPDFKSKLESVFAFLQDNGFVSCFLEDVIS